LRGDWQAAAKSLERTLSISPSDEALSNYAIVLDKLKRHKEARGQSGSGCINQQSHPIPVVDVNAFTRRDAPTVTSR
jgi:hypothetical protein